MADGTRHMPLPEPRRAPTLAIKVAVFLRQGVPCAICGERLDPDAFEMDHIHRLDALGSQMVDNWQALCPTCHGRKSVIDNREAKKGARIRGETGPVKRMREHGPLLTSRNDLVGKNRPFDKRLTRGFDGTAKPRVAKAARTGPAP